jgi:hypothetical protein
MPPADGREGPSWAAPIKPGRSVVLARPEGYGRALTACRIPIEGRDEWVAASRVKSA